MRILVCGGRGYDRTAAFNWLEENLKDEISVATGISAFAIEAIIHGGTRGADEGADDFAQSEGIKIMRFLADWKHFGKAAGPMRNQKMLDEGHPDIVVAFPGGRGTADMVNRARAAGVPVIEVPE